MYARDHGANDSQQLQNEDCKVQKSNLAKGGFTFFNLQFAFYIKRLRLTGAYPSLDAISIRGVVIRYWKPSNELISFFSSSVRGTLAFGLQISVRLKDIGCSPTYPCMMIKALILLYLHNIGNTFLLAS